MRHRLKLQMAKSKCQSSNAKGSPGSKGQRGVVLAFRYLDLFEVGLIPHLFCVIASPSPPVILTLNEVKGKDLVLLMTGSAKNLPGLRVDSAWQSPVPRPRLLRRPDESRLLTMTKREGIASVD